MLLGASLAVVHRGVTRFRGASCLHANGQWLAVGFESGSGNSKDSPEANVKGFLDHHAHQFLGAFSELDACKVACEAFLHALCDDHTSPLSECGCEAIA